MQWERTNKQKAHYHHQIQIRGSVRALVKKALLTATTDAITADARA
jgi:hypothetical protein